MIIFDGRTLNTWNSCHNSRFDMFRMQKENKNIGFVKDFYKIWLVIVISKNNRDQKNHTKKSKLCDDCSDAELFSIEF